MAAEPEQPAAEAPVSGGDVQDDVPPKPTGDTVQDMNNYRGYHGLDRVFGYLLQHIVMNKPEDPVKDLIDQVEGMKDFAELRKTVGNAPYTTAMMVD
uniref:Uncharacterized protein n=1 Tax=Hemiselmis andersenii TaxID=464988 RepID=A0A6T8PHM3_HEMAN|mmetsp:Transcript_47982/g.116534  ORF Transcript_47982/g.116534 Transcript_47982/m.116534 type:complete len:97 (+) Transcript_47982:46-336(+)